MIDIGIDIDADIDVDIGIGVDNDIDTDTDIDAERATKKKTWNESKKTHRGILSQEPREKNYFNKGGPTSTSRSWWQYDL